MLIGGAKWKNATRVVRPVFCVNRPRYLNSRSVPGAGSVPQTAVPGWPNPDPATALETAPGE